MLIHKRGRGFRPSRIKHGTVVHYPDGANWESNLTRIAPTRGIVNQKYKAEVGAVKMLANSIVATWGVTASENGHPEYDYGHGWAEHVRVPAKKDVERMVEASDALAVAHEAYEKAVAGAWKRGRKAKAQDVLEAAKELPKTLKLEIKDTLNKTDKHAFTYDY